MTIKSFFFIYLCSFFIDIADGTCYFIDGKEATDRFTCSDPNTVSASMCCEKHNGQYFDSCTDGICAYTYAPGPPGQYDDGLAYWRDSCTDPTWQDPACVNIASCEKYLDDQKPNVRVDDVLDVTASAVRLNKCADGRFCGRNTDDSNTTCCYNHDGEFVRPSTAANDGLATSTSASLSQSSSAPLSQSSSAPLSQSSSASSNTIPSLIKSTSVLYSSSAASPDVATSTSSSKTSQDDGRRLSNAAEIATIVGSVVGALAFILTLVFGILSWKRRRSHSRLSRVSSNG